MAVYDLARDQELLSDLEELHDDSEEDLVGADWHQDAIRVTAEGLLLAGPERAQHVIVGKHGRVLTVPMPTWVKVAIDTWTSPADVVDGYVFRSVNRGDQVQGNVLSEKVVWQMLRPYAAAAGVPGIAPHDCRRTAAKSRVLISGGFGPLE